MNADRKSARTTRWLGVALGTVLWVGALAVLVLGAWELAKPDYLATILLTLTGLSLLHASIELLRPEMGD